MKDVRQLLTEKETEMARVQKEIESLQMILPLLADEETPSGENTAELSKTMDRKPPENESQATAEASATGTNGPISVPPDTKWSFARRWRSK